MKGTCGLAHGGLHLFHPGTGKLTRYLINPGDSTSLINNQVRVLYTDKQGTLWAGTGSPFGNETEEGGGGLNRFHPETGTFTRYMHDADNPGTLLDNKVRAIRIEREKSRERELMQGIMILP
jgi:hypothetical protein